LAAYGISVALLRPLAELLGRLDLDPASFLAALGIDDASAPETYVPGESVDRTLDALAARRGDPALALTLARMAVAKPLGLFSHMVWLSGTVRDALHRAVRFYAMVSRRTTLTLDEPPDGIATLRQHAVAGVTRGAILTEFAFASLALRARAATAGRFTLRAVCFAHDRQDAAPYRELFEAPVTFGAITSAALEAKIAQLTAAPTGRSPFLDRVRRAAAADLGGTITTIAAQLGISARTLRRHLEQEGTSLRVLLDDVRRERADELLAAGTPVKEIAFGLGFSEPSAFSRAYKRWTGKPPRPR
jgi:AraC-like DNA-binding protein